MPIVSIRQLHFPIELSESDFSLFHLVNQVFQIISKDDTEVGTIEEITIWASLIKQILIVRSTLTPPRLLKISKKN